MTPIDHDVVIWVGRAKIGVPRIVAENLGLVAGYTYTPHVIGEIGRSTRALIKVREMMHEANRAGGCSPT